MIALNSKNFKSAVAAEKKRVVLVVFRSTFCEHCHALLDRMVGMEQEWAADFLFCNVNCSDHLNTPLADEYGIASYPSGVLLFRGAVVADFEGEISERQLRGEVLGPVAKILHQKLKKG